MVLTCRRIWCQEGYGSIDFLGEHDGVYKRVAWCLRRWKRSLVFADGFMVSERGIRRLKIVLFLRSERRVWYRDRSDMKIHC